MDNLVIVTEKPQFVAKNSFTVAQGSPETVRSEQARAVTEEQDCIRGCVHLKIRVRGTLLRGRRSPRALRLVIVLWTLAATLGLVVGLTPAWAETGEAAWLRYQPIQDPAVRRRYDSLPSAVVTLGDSEVLRSARLELVRGVGGMLGRRLSAEPNHTGPNLTEPQPPGGFDPPRHLGPTARRPAQPQGIRPGSSFEPSRGRLLVEDDGGSGLAARRDRRVQ